MGQDTVGETSGGPTYLPSGDRTIPVGGSIHPSGLTWISTEPWGWITYHYGAFGGMLLESAGSGDQEAPTPQGSVYWHWGPSYVGWVPAGPYSPVLPGPLLRLSTRTATMVAIHRFGNDLRPSLDPGAGSTNMAGLDILFLRPVRLQKLSSDT